MIVAVLVLALAGLATTGPCGLGLWAMPLPTPRLPTPRFDPTATPPGWTPPVFGPALTRAPIVLPAEPLAPENATHATVLETWELGRTPLGSSAAGAATVGDTLAVGWSLGVDLFDAHTFAPRGLLPVPGGLLALAPDGEHLALASYDKRVESLFHSYLSRALAFAPDGRVLAANGPGGLVRLWSFADGSFVRDMAVCAQCDVLALAYTTDGHALVTAGTNCVRVWDLTAEPRARGRLLRAWESWPASAANTLAFAPDNRTLATSGIDGVVRLWDTSTGAFVRAWSVNNAVTSLAFSPYGRSLATGSADGVGVWRPADGSYVDRITLPPWSNTPYVAYVPDGVEFPLVMAPGCQPGAWEIGDLDRLAVWITRRCGARRIALNSSWLALSRDGRVVFWGVR
jgi:hypothetical protein